MPFDLPHVPFEVDDTILSGEVNDVFEAIEAVLDGGITNENVSDNADLDPLKFEATSGSGYATLAAQVDALSNAGAYVATAGDTMTGLLVVDGGLGGPITSDTSDSAYPDYPHCSASDHKLAMSGAIGPKVILTGGEKVRLRGRIISIPESREIDISGGAAHLHALRLTLASAGEPTAPAFDWDTADVVKTIPHALEGASGISGIYGSSSAAMDATIIRNVPYVYGEASGAGTAASGATPYYFPVDNDPAAFSVIPTTAYGTGDGATNFVFGTTNGQTWRSDMLTFLTGANKGLAWRIRWFDKSNQRMYLDTTVSAPGVVASGDVFVIEAVGSCKKNYNPLYRTDGLGTAKSSRISALFAKAYSHNSATVRPTLIKWPMHAYAGLKDRLSGVDYFSSDITTLAVASSYTITHNVGKPCRGASIRVIPTTGGGQGIDHLMAGTVMDLATVTGTQESGVYIHNYSQNAVKLYTGTNYICTIRDGGVPTVTNYGITAADVWVQLEF